jgi:hypothetical protein
MHIEIPPPTPCVPVSTSEAQCPRAEKFSYDRLLDLVPESILVGYLVRRGYWDWIGAGQLRRRWKCDIESLGGVDRCDWPSPDCCGNDRQLLDPRTDPGEVRPGRTDPGDGAGGGGDGLRVARSAPFPVNCVMHLDGEG